VIVKVITALVVFIAIGALGFTLLGEGVFTTVPQAQAQAIINEATDVEDAMEIYAMNNDGVVDIGDPTLGQTTLHFVKEVKLLKAWAGDEFDVSTDPWEFNENDKAVERVVANEEVCQMINHMRGNEAPDAEVYACDTPEGENQYCCASSS
jgi:hypothetical protein